MAQINIVLDGVDLPVPDSFILDSRPNSSDNMTLNATLYTDFVNVSRSWTVTWTTMCKEEYDALYDIWFNQFSTFEYPTLEVDYYGIAVPVKVDMNPKDIRWDGNNIRNIQIVLREQNAIS